MGRCHAQTQIPQPNCSGNVAALQPATSGSASVDLPTTCTVTVLDSSAHLIPTAVNGPLEQGQSVLLLGRSSTTLLGLFVPPGVIDADFSGEIKIMVWTPFLPCTVSQGSKISQLIFFTVPMSTNTVQKRNGEEGFGSTGAPQIFWTQQLTVQRLTCKCKLSWQGQHVTLTGIFDTGADVMVISQAKWPPRWPLTAVPQALTGIRRSSTSFQSKNFIQIVGPEGHTATIKPFVLQIPTVLWGHDMLSQMGVRIGSDFS